MCSHFSVVPSLTVCIVFQHQTFHSYLESGIPILTFFFCFFVMDLYAFILFWGDLNLISEIILPYPTVCYS